MSRPTWIAIHIEQCAIVSNCAFHEIYKTAILFLFSMTTASRLTLNIASCSTSFAAHSQYIPARQPLISIRSFSHHPRPRNESHSSSIVSLYRQLPARQHRKQRLSELQPVAASYDASADRPLSTSSQDAASAAAAAPVKKRSSLVNRAIFGTILGLSGAVVIVTGGWLYAAVTCLVAYQVSQELIGMVTAKGIAEGMKPPPPLVNTATSFLCVLLNAWVFVSGGRSASAMAVSEGQTRQWVEHKARLAHCTRELPLCLLCSVVNCS